MTLTISIWFTKQKDTLRDGLRKKVLLKLFKLQKKVLLNLFKLQMYLDLEADWLVTTWYRKTPLYTSWAQLSKYISYVFVLNNNNSHLNQA